MKVVTYNIQYWTGMDGVQDPERTLHAVLEMDPDIVALQEVAHPLPYEGTSALQALADALGGEYVFAEIWPAGTFAKVPQPMGLALISRYPILAYANHRLSHEGPGETRRLLEVRVLLPGDRPLTVYTTHLEWRWEDVRVQQVRSLLLWTTRDRGKPHLLLGDFNTVHPDDVADFEAAGGNWQEFAESQPHPDFIQATPHPQALAHVVKAGYVDAFRTVGQGDGRTYTTGRPTLRLDYCFVDPSLKDALITARRWDTDLGWSASDHFPLYVEIEE